MENRYLNFKREPHTSSGRRGAAGRGLSPRRPPALLHRPPSIPMRGAAGSRCRPPFACPGMMW